MAAVSRYWMHAKKYNYYYYIFLTAFSRTAWVSQHQKGKPFWILLEQEMMGWQWHLLDHMQIICTSLQTDNRTSISPLSFYRLDALPATQRTASNHWRQTQTNKYKCIQNLCSSSLPNWPAALIKKTLPGNVSGRILGCNVHFSCLCL